MPFSFLKRKKKEAPKSSPYFDLIVKDIIHETSDAISIVFEQPKNGNLEYKPGQFITIIQTIGGKKVRRAYSLCSSPVTGELPAVTVKRVQGGIMSNFLNDQLKPGDTVSIMEPMGVFVLDTQKPIHQHVFLFGGGSGITPLLSIAKTLLQDHPKSKVSLIYANKDIDSIIFRDTLKSLELDYPDRLRTIHYLETPPADWTGEIGYLTPDKLTSNINQLNDSKYPEAVYMTCGPEPMMNIVVDTLKARGIHQDRIFKESFVAGTTSPQEIIASDEPKEVSVLLDGQIHKFDVPADKSILEAGLDLGLDLPYSCQSGLCTACRGKCSSGEVKMEDVSVLSHEEVSEGYVLMCISKPKTDNVVIEVG